MEEFSAKKERQILQRLNLGTEDVGVKHDCHHGKERTNKSWNSDIV